MAAQPQPADSATYAHKLDKAEGRLDFSRTAEALARQVRAFDPWPGCDAEFSGERLRVWAAHALPDKHEQPPGTLLAATRNGLDIACVDGALRITALQRSGGKRISAVDFLNARSDLRAAS